MAIILDGKLASAAIKQQLKEKVDIILNSGKRAPHLVAILVGNDGASETYVASKIKNCSEIGFNSSLHRLNSTCTEQELIELIEKCNNDNDIDGILVQLPLPKHISESKIIESINPTKDVDGFHPQSVGKLVQGIDSFIPATPYGILLMLQHYKIDVKGKHAVVIGRSNIVGRPMSILLSHPKYGGNATVTICHSHTPNMKEICKQADILVAALGKPNFITKDYIKEGAVVIDVGITRVEDNSTAKGFRIVGDVNFNEVKELCSYITPVPGGVGLMTIAGLLSNTLKSFENNHQ